MMTHSRLAIEYIHGHEFDYMMFHTVFFMYNFLVHYIHKKAILSGPIFHQT